METNKLIETNKTVIIVSFVCPIPATQGNRQVIHNLILWLKKNGYRVIFVLQVLQIDNTLRNKLEALVDDLYIPGKPYSGLHKTSLASIVIFAFVRKFKRIVKYLIGPSLSKKIEIFLKKKKLRQTRSCWQETKEMVQDLASRFKAHAIIAEYIYMTPCFTGLTSDVLRLTHTHDMLSRIRDEVGAHGVDTQGIDCTPAEERGALLRGDIIIALQHNEAQLFQKLVPEREVITVTYSTNKIVGSSHNDIVPNSVLMVASKNPANVRGVILFCEKVWPLVLKKIPDAQFIVVGGACEELQGNFQNVIKQGIIKSLEQEYRKAAVVVNPVDLGTGLKIKTVEALCFSKAMVTTKAGVEGLLLDNPPCIICDDWHSFAHEVIGLLSHEQSRLDLEKKALNYALTHFTPKASYKELDFILKRHIPHHDHRANWMIS